MTDPLAEIVTLLQPSASFSKVVNAAGVWRISRSEAGRPFYAVILEGGCLLSVHGRETMELGRGDFILVPAAYEFSTSSLRPPPPGDGEVMPVQVGPSEFRLGQLDGPVELRMVVGYCDFGSPDAALLVSLLPELVQVQGETRLAALVQLIDDEARQRRPARDIVLAHLLQVLLIEALRSVSGPAASPGLVRGLSDERLASALRRMHEQPTAPWTVEQMAREAGLSRSMFFERFRHAVGLAPMEYLLAWRMAIAKDLLRREAVGIADVAERVGYGSASTFSVAFSRQVGVSPAAYARANRAGPRSPPAQDSQ
ncbi:AraC family transcriptional regulator [Bosea sp. 117]|uniref:AraC family transcriptional regulator n=1 Tax=Bosea sp. 117 TaxID=1125973 RepID=UPI00068D01FA|nr:AraC family transcriptional regulator [Bosea sp. 117]